jgi:hypothetical protein
MKRFVAALIVALILPAVPAIAAENVAGRWILSLTDRNRTLVGLLEIEKSGDGWIAHLEGGPASVETDGNKIVIVADSRDVRGFVFDRRMTGTVESDAMSGTYVQEGAAAQAEAPGPWKAEREPPKKAIHENTARVDLSGTWTATQELDFRKYSMALTPDGAAWLETYLPYYDQPDVRCTSIGLPALMTYSFPFEIITSDNRLTMVYEYQSKVRRIWMDGRKPGEYMVPSRMGHSIGHWEGGTLVIQTSHLEKTVRDFRGELISENARIEERYSLGEDGITLTAVVTVHDPDNYERPPVRRRMWKRDNSAEIFPYTCDPDSFYLQMYEDGEMDMYIERTDRRF